MKKDDLKKLMGLLMEAEQERNRELPAIVYEHGYVTEKEAAELLEATPAQVLALLRTGGGLRRELRARKRNRVPLSEVRRALQIQRERDLDRIADKAADIVRGGPSNHFGPFADWGERGYDAAGAAERLGLSQAEVRRLVDRGELFSFGWKTRPLITKEELEAYGKKLQSQATAAKRAA